MKLEQANEAALCKCFVVSLAGLASFWYNFLPSNSISSFGELGNKFSTHFIGSTRSSKRALQMFDVIQKPNESIRDFVEIFHREKGYDIEQCYQLKKYIKHLIKNGTMIS